MKIAAIMMVIIGSLALCAVGINFVVQLDVNATAQEREQMRAQVSMLEGIAASPQADNKERGELTGKLALAKIAMARYPVILLGLASLVSVFMLRRLKFIAVGLLFIVPVALAVYVPLSLIMTFPLVIGSILAFFVVRKGEVPAIEAAS